MCNVGSAAWARRPGAAAVAVPPAPAVMPNNTHNAAPAVAMARRRLDIRCNLNGSPFVVHGFDRPPDGPG